MSDRIARAFNRSGPTQAVALVISKAFNRVWHDALLHKLRSYEISSQICGLVSSFFSNRRLWVVQYGKFSQEYPVNAGAHQGSILGPTLFLLLYTDCLLLFFYFFIFFHFFFMAPHFLHFWSKFF